MSGGQISAGQGFSGVAHVDDVVKKINEIFDQPTANEKSSVNLRGLKSISPGVGSGVKPKETFETTGVNTNNLLELAQAVFAEEKSVFSRELQELFVTALKNMKLELGDINDSIKILALVQRFPRFRTIFTREQLRKAEFTARTFGALKEAGFADSNIEKSLSISSDDGNGKLAALELAIKKSIKPIYKKVESAEQQNIKKITMNDASLIRPISKQASNLAVAQVDYGISEQKPSHRRQKTDEVNGPMPMNESTQTIKDDRGYINRDTFCTAVEKDAAKKRAAREECMQEKHDWDFVNDFETLAID